MKISGSGHIAAGEYSEKISVSGSGKVNGNLRCPEFSSSGYTSCEGDLDCLNKVSISGSVSFAKNLSAKELRVSGSVV